MLRKLLAALLGAGVALAMGSVVHGCADREPGARTTIAVIPKGTTHVFWQAVEQGARAAGEAAGVEIVWKGPLQENDRAQQIQLVQQFVAQGVSAMVLAPLDHQALAGPVAEACAKGIPVVIFDSALDGEPGRDFVSFVATDSAAAGRVAGEHMGRLLGGAGDAVVLRYLVGSASTQQREDGFIEGARAAGLAIASDNRHAGATAGEAKTAALNMIDQVRAAGGVFTPNESSTYGMLMALRQAELIGKVRFIGFDASPPLVEALAAGEIDGLVVQNPRKMGQLAVEAAVRATRGEPVEPVVDTGAVLVTRENMGEAEIKRLLE